jgi:hypothetical protein
MTNQGMRAIVWLAFVTAASGQAQVITPEDGVPTDPIRCWRRSSAGAVRVGEPFDVVLTCAVLEIDAVTVVPDQTALEPAVVQMPPFEVVGGSHPADLRTDDRRFFQYRYELRLIVDDAFGQDIEVPPLELSYRIRSRGPQGAALEGRDQTYLMPPIAIHVLALVRDELRDIRDSGGGSFDDLESRTLRGRILLVLGALFALLGVIVAIVTVVRRPGLAGDRAKTARTLLSDGVVLGGVDRELTSIRHDRQAQGWTQALAGRTLAACRIAAAFSLSGRVSQSAAVPGGDAEEGELRLHGGWVPRRTVRVSGWETPETVRQALARRVSSKESERACLEVLEEALARLSEARYGRDNGLDEVALDRALESGAEVVRRLQHEHRWPATMYRAAARFAAAQRNRVWTR